MLTAAEEVLLAACHDRPRSADAATWADVLALADAHEVSPIVFAALQACRRRHREESLAGPGRPDQTALPDENSELWHAFEHRYVAAMIQHGLACQELRKVLDALDGIPALALKGPALTSYLYPDSCRMYSDLDVAVHDHDYLRARDALLAMGYRPMSPYDERFQRAIGKDLAFVRRDERDVQWSVELHWRLAEPSAVPLDEQGIWDRSIEVVVGGAAVRTLGPEDALLLLALNLRKHRFTRLKTLVDIDRLLRRDGARIDWSVLHAHAHAADACIALRHTLTLAGEHLHSPVGPLPGCTRYYSLRRHVLRRFVTEDVVLCGGRERTRPAQSLDLILGLMPFVTLDRTSTTVRLVYRRLALSPEYASYRLGAHGRYRTRLSYLADTVSRFARAVTAAVSSTGVFHRPIARRGVLHAPWATSDQHSTSPADPLVERKQPTANSQ